VRSNPRYRDDERFGSFYHQLLAKLAYNDGDASEAIHQLETARSIVYHDHLDVMIVSLLVAEQQFDDAREYLRVARAELPRHVFRRIARHAMLGELDRYVEEAAASRP
jgi:predicted negative regulator of RcsB-dependent stress response